MHRSLSHRVPFCLVLIVFASLLLASAAAGAAPSGSTLTRPSLTSAAVAAPGSITVMGTGFTPGGQVELVVADAWSATVVETRSITADRMSFGRNGSQDPAAGFVPGGTMSVPVDHLCGIAPIVRAYDVASETWSSWLGVDTTGFAVAVFGPNGSADPALGYIHPCDAVG